MEPVGQMSSKSTDNLATLAAIGLLAYASADIVHHVLGHGAACLLLGGRIRSLSSVFVNCTVTGAAVDLAGPLANFVLGIVALLALRGLPRATTPTRLLLILVAAFNLFWLELQLVFSAATRTDDWAWAMHVFHVPEPGRYAMIGAGMMAYFVTARAVAALLAPFASPVARVRRIVVVAWLAGGAIACATAAFDPHPVAALLHGAAPQSLLLSIGLLFLPPKAARRAPAVEPASVIEFSWPWVMAATVIGVASMALLGPGFALSI
ncbi:MAG TPA: hypothetical protein VGH80_06425 [Xanthomonadaceae bacterium]